MNTPLKFPHFIPILILVIVAGTFVQSCERIVPLSEVDLPNSEKIVVSAAIIAGQPIRNVQITRSISPVDTFSLEKIGIRDADVRITVDGREVRLRLQTAVDSVRLPTSGRLVPGPTSYEALDLIAQAGKLYTITVRWNNLTATAQTRVPESPQAESLPPLVWQRQIRERIITTGIGGGTRTVYDTSLSALPIIPMLTRSQEMYSARQQTLRDTVLGARFIQQSSFQPAIPRIGSDGKQSVLVGFNSVQTDALGRIVFLEFDTQTRMPKQLIFRQQTTVLEVELEARDGAIKDFLDTSGRLSEGTSFNPLGNSGSNPKWNVRGDGIGLFIGQSTTTTVTLRPQ